MDSIWLDTERKPFTLEPNSGIQVYLNPTIIKISAMYGLTLAHTLILIQDGYNYHRTLLGLGVGNLYFQTQSWDEMYDNIVKKFQLIINPTGGILVSDLLFSHIAMANQKESLNTCFIKTFGELNTYKLYMDKADDKIGIISLYPNTCAFTSALFIFKYGIHNTFLNWAGNPFLS
jgi:hypothetical protein